MLAQTRYYIQYFLRFYLNIIYYCPLEHKIGIIINIVLIVKSQILENTYEKNMDTHHFFADFKADFDSNKRR